jgi:hypothetical protein
MLASFAREAEQVFERQVSLVLNSPLGMSHGEFAQNHVDVKRKWM